MANYFKVGCIWAIAFVLFVWNLCFGKRVTRKELKACLSCNWREERQIVGELNEKLKAGKLTSVYMRAVLLLDRLAKTGEVEKKINDMFGRRLTMYRLTTPNT